MLNKEHENTATRTEILIGRVKPEGKFFLGVFCTLKLKMRALGGHDTKTY